MDDNETKVFDWTNLNVESGSHEFRLLKLLPSTEHHAEIRCQLFHSSLDSHPGYEALSYAWGDANVTLPICLNSLEHHVTVNLEMALRYLRLEDQERILWIDALCINQRYILEKNHQVKNMRTIYLQAGRVVVWLGEEGTAQLAIDFCRRRQQIMESGLNEDIEEPPTEDNDIEEDIKICWDLFMGRKYWARLWVVQEIHHHNPVLVQIGKVSIDFGELYNLYATYQRTSIARLLKIEWQGEPQITLPYGFHSWNFERNSKLPNREIGYMHYWESQTSLAWWWIMIELHELYRTVCQSLVKTSLSFLLLVEQIGRACGSSELPTWLPDLTMKQRIIPRIIFAYEFAFNASPTQQYSDAPARIDNNSLLVNGFVVGTVTEAYDAAIESDDFEETLKQFRLFRYEKTLAGMTCEGRFTDESTALFENLPRRASKIEEPEMFNSSWGPFLTEKGDIILAAVGSRVPLVLRKNQIDYSFIGACILVDFELSVEPNPECEKGFSDIMGGNFWGYELEKFTIY